MSDTYAVIGGTGVYSPELFVNFTEKKITTQFGEVILSEGLVNQHSVVFLSRHGTDHSIPPHKINYRANIAALKQLGVTQIIATNAVGGIVKNSGPGAFIIPDQIIDYTWGREHTYFDSFTDEMKHIDFTFPFDSILRDRLVECIAQIVPQFLEKGCYGCTQGPRLETAAEIKKFEKDGCDIIGMTGMPEAALAKELDMAYASVCFSVNWAAGITEDISMEEIQASVSTSVIKIRKILSLFFS